mmetsp:Transcript_95641/g.309817  ORF Transcript_95641/g.309817 Transcript_95641/m.309817 type:complete len:82 (-) Transcript_95641:536-781(-)
MRVQERGRWLVQPLACSSSCTTWTDGVRSYVSELMGCSCGWRPNKLGAAAGQPPPMMPADEGSSPENRDRASPARGGRTRT